MELAAIAAALPPSGSTRALALRREWATENGVADGIRTHDNRNHNPGLYQLSYSHHCVDQDRSRSTNNFLHRTDHREPSWSAAPNWRARQDSNLLPPA